MKKNLYRVAEASHWRDLQSTDSCWLIKGLEETIALGQTLIQAIPDLKLLLLEGPLGAGKTSLVKGIAIGLRIKEPITSPTFPLAQHYQQGTSALFHLDLYRIENHESANELFIEEEEEARNLNAVMVVEWPERLMLALPDAWRIKLEHCPNGDRIAQVLTPKSPARKANTS